MEIRRAKQTDLKRINDLLYQVLNIHALSRPDLFIAGSKKFTDEQLIKRINDLCNPVFVATIDKKVLGYVFCEHIQLENHNVLKNVKTLYIDDLCVDETARGKGIGKALYDYVVAYAKDKGYYNVTLNVWADNDLAKKFYQKVGLKMQKIGMEQIL